VKILQGAIGLLLIMSLCGCQAEPQVVTEYVVVEKPVEMVVIKTVIQEVPVVLVREVEVPVKLKDFESLKELEEWLGGRIFLLKEDADCDDYATWLQRKAMRDGYFVSFEAITAAEYNVRFEDKIEVNEIHAINSVIIGNNFYYIEPQTSEVALGACLD